jgi:hypothetical protein
MCVGKPEIAGLTDRTVGRYVLRATDDVALLIAAARGCGLPLQPSRAQEHDCKPARCKLSLHHAARTHEWIALLR